MVLLLLIPLSGISQTRLTLNECRDLSRENFPKMKQVEVLNKIAELKNRNTQSNYLPQIDLKGQATYQSDVIEINLPIPNFSFDPVSKDQYKMYLDVKQTIWDGGMTKSKKELELAGLESDVQKLEIEIQQVYTMVDAYFFGNLMADNNLKVLQAQQAVLESQIQKLGSAISLGAAREKEKLKLEMENLLMDQKMMALSSQKRSFLEMLGILTGQSLDENTNLIVPENLNKQTEQLRPELKYFNLQTLELNSGDKLLKATRNPLFFGFGQAGYGKPGFNMLSNEFAPYYIVGLGLNWRVIDWKNSQRNREINIQNRAMIATLQNDFLQKQALQKVDAAEKINNLKELIQTDEKMVIGRKAIAESASAELLNGIITSTDYLIDLNAQTVAQINLEMHKIQLIQAIVNYNSILGY